MFNLSIVTAIFIITIIGLTGLSLFLQRKTTSPFIEKLTTVVTQAITKPLIAILIIYIIHFLAILLLNYIKLNINYCLYINLVGRFINVLLILVLFWFVVRLMNTLTDEFYKWSVTNSKRVGIIFFPLINNSLKAIATLILINIILPYLTIPKAYLPFAEKAATLLLITAITWVAVQVINTSEQYFLQRHGTLLPDNLKSRKVYTQITVLRKIAISVVITLAIAIALTIFDRVREIGTTLLASAGVIAAIGAFAAQKTLAGMFSGLQIALTQPIRINDAVVVENEFGEIEEITLNYVVIKLWDLRRLVVPINYFMEKPFQNWTRNSSNLIGAIFLYVDYSLPINEIRQKFNEFLATSPLWDKKLAAVQVTDAKENTMEVRFLVSSDNAGNVFTLRCEVREKLITYIQTNYPKCLPQIRINNETSIKGENST